MYKMLRILCISLDVTEPSIIACASSIIFCKKKITFSKKIIIHIKLNYRIVDRKLIHPKSHGNVHRNIMTWRCFTVSLHS